ncbi:2-C-methyl-D-erythritol 4-phosphate cytidylyltransferase [Litorivivens lipolytica]|uniref:2-C-methyl-D-erythritol 4-phosphate cytidylyltransferase n=1 Tax=Litorivivens lipolytica TaxID=1524264 RepID=A0A7W4W226_9GAMM|nr:2-C-methyl-D-erythritol 4-phosphate cytidylyltransferase [Litorivivens lipolytica]MBB3046031.1 2-C-methyl-D-erythritol 4-phosphate cytidylyltransferase [Litorivivens lipolytica]
MTATPSHFWAVVPAAGIGSRMQTETPKQYLNLAGKTVLSRSLGKLLAVPFIERIMVALSPNDAVWPSLPEASESRISTVAGGSERADSVLAALKALDSYAAPDDWVLVHDAARPCVQSAAISRMLITLADHPVGGIMATPIADTVKQVDAEQGIAATLDRSRLWAAQTPQLFRYGLLVAALEKALDAGVTVTDEASAVEWAGHTPKLFSGSRTNLKITVPEDLHLAELILAAEGE